MVSDAYRFVIPALALGIVFFWFHIFSVAVIFILLAAFVCFFFRNPNRNIPEGKNLVVSPADGKIVKISQGPGSNQTICIFLNIFNVHVNRSPIAGELVKFEYKRGKFKVAYDEEASRVNEQNVLTIAGSGITVTVQQVAGLIARRVICWKKPGNALARGELFGLIRFGSRVDVVVPGNVTIKVKVGEHVQGGSSVLGEYA